MTESTSTTTMTENPTPAFTGVVPYPDDAIQRYRDAGYWGDRTLAEEFRTVAERHPDQLAVIAADGELTYRQLNELTDRIAVGLSRLGLEPGDPVILQVPNSVNTVVAWYAILKAGLVPVCTLPLHRAHEIGSIGAQCGARAHVVEAADTRFDLVAFAAEMASVVDSLAVTITINGADGTPGDLLTLADGIDPSQAREAVASIQSAIDHEALAVLQLSGGTTGVPKLIPRLHAEYWYNARAYAEAWGWDTTSRVAHVLPIIHNAGIVCALHSAHAFGATLLLSEPTVDTGIPFLADYGVTDLVMFPGLLASMGVEAWAPALRQVRHLILAGSKVPDTLFDDLERRDVWVGQLFGMGEGFFMITPLSSPRWVRANTVGWPMSALDEMRIVEPGTETDVSDGQEGELICRGPYTVRGYYRAEQHNSVVFTADGFYRTGDLVVANVRDNVRAVSVEGRIKDLIDRGGEKINASEVEELLMDHPSISEAAVVAMPDARLGERACAYLVLTAGTTEFTIDDARTYLNGRGVAKFKWPERIETVPSLPYTKVSKVDKKALRADIVAKLQAEPVDSADG